MPDPTEQTTHTYDQHAATYAALNASADPILPLLDRFCAQLPTGAPQGGVVLDVGCGHGRDAALFAARGYRVLGLDRSIGQLTVAREQAPGAGFLLGDMRRLPCRSDAVDGLWACASLPHLPRDQAPLALAEFRRVLKPGGLLYLGVKAGDGERWVASEHFDGAARFFTFYGAADIEAQAGDAGFNVVERFESEGWINLFARA